MLNPIEQAVVRRLGPLRAELVHHTSSALDDALPPFGVPAHVEDRAAFHHEQMTSTVERFHDMVQLGATLDWRMVAFEYGWAARVLGNLGVTWDHQVLLINAYFAAAADLLNADQAERQAIAAMAGRLAQLAEQAYRGEASESN